MKMKGIIQSSFQCHSPLPLHCFVMWKAGGVRREAVLEITRMRCSSKLERSHRDKETTLFHIQSAFVVAGRLYPGPHAC